MADPKIKYDIEAAVSGEKDINSLAQQLEDMGKILGADLSPAAKTAAAEMRALGEQQGAIVAFAKLSEQVKTAERDLALAQKSAKSFTADISAAGPPTAQQAATLSRLNDQVKNSETKLTGQKDALHGASQELLKYGLTGDRLIEAQRQTAAAVDALKTSVQASIPSFHDAGAAGASSAQQISNAWSVLGVKSAKDLQAQIAQVRAALETVRDKAGATGPALNAAFSAGNAKIADLERQLREVNGQMTLGDKTAKLFSGSIGQISAGNIVADGVGYLASKVKGLGQAFIDAIVQGDQMRRGLTAIYGDAGTAAKQIDFLRKSSSESGVSFGALSGEFVKFSAAMKSANVPVSQSNDLFRAVTAATASLGLSAEATGGTLNALGQMASKGTVSMEELRQQLGDRLPGAMGLTAKGLGITEGQLIKLVESGGLATRDFIVPFTKALGSLKGEADGLVPAFERIKGTLTEVAQGAGDAGWTQVLMLALKGLGVVVSGLAIGISVLSEAFFLVVKGATAAALALTDPKAAMELMNDAADGATKRLTAQAVSFQNMVSPAQQAAVAMGEVAKQAVATAASLGGVGAAQELAALGAKLNADATLDLGAKLVQYNVAAAEMLKTQEANTQALGKAAAAAKQQGDTLVELARLQGDETAIVSASVEASRLHVQALEKVAAAQKSESDMLQAQKEFIVANHKARGELTEAMKKEIGELDKKIVKAVAETEQSRQATDAAKAEAFARDLLSKALLDNSQNVDKYKAAMDQARATLREYERLALNGKKTDEDVAAARKAVTGATVLYKDALKDLAAAHELEFRARQAGMQLAIAHLQVAQQSSSAMAAQARSIGDVETATYYEIKAKEQAIAIMKMEIEMRRLESELALKSIEIKRKTIDVTTDEGKAKLQMLDIEAALIKIKLVANDAAKETIKGIEREIQGLREGTGLRDQSTSSIGRETGARGSNTDAINAQSDAMMKIAMQYKNSVYYTEQEIDLLIREVAARERLAEFKRKVDNVDKQGFTLDRDGNRLSANTPTDRSTFENAKQQGLSDAQALAVMGRFWQNGKQAGTAEAVQNGSNWYVEVQKSIDQMVLANAAKAAKAAATNTSTPPAPNLPGKNYTVTINFDGSSRQYGASSDADAQALISVLQRAKLSA